MLLLTGLPLYLESWKNLEFDNLGKKKPGKTWNFEQKTWKNLEFLRISTCSVVKIWLDS